ncbi:MAG TPA: EamA family transporter [Candidatus Contendobacter sp.]|nr:EamA family transporter [Candidatus Contendobacter sp.]HRD48518.1 EamA family transporter [Candidatus Contendobacter sp.]
MIPLFHRFAGMKGIGYAIQAALLFGAATPFAKLLLNEAPPLLLAGLLYLGAGTGLALWIIARRGLDALGRSDEAALSARDLPWLGGAVLTGGVLGPILLMTGLRLTPATSASLLLNLESVFTALIAWFAFRENFDRRIAMGMLAIVAASLLLSWQGALEFGSPWGSICIIGACGCWAMDNNLTRQVSAHDPLQIACIKGLAAGSVSTLMAWLGGMALPSPGVVAAAALVGFLGYGLSLALYILALRHIGVARTGAYFALAPFAGAVLALVMLGEVPGMLFWLAMALMAWGLWLHLSERHEHEHAHDESTHNHQHTHDEHHRHSHDFPWDGREPHTHSHHHAGLWHAHPHFPDIHHRHDH